MTRLDFPGKFAPFIWFIGSTPVACIIPSVNVPGRYVGYIAHPVLVREVGPLDLSVVIEKIEDALTDLIPDAA